MSTTAETSRSTAIEGYERLAPEVRKRWALEQIQTIRNTVGRDLSAAEFQMGMAIAAQYNLDPLLKEIWFAKGRSKNGEPGRVMIMVGRDGLLRNARRDASYLGFDADVVREKDDFRVQRSKDGREVVHEYAGGSEARGAILGAWAQVYRRGHPDVYFFAPWDEYYPSSADYRSPWKKQGSVMIQKCALSLCLRLAFNLSGVVGEDEGAAIYDEWQGGQDGTTEATEGDVAALVDEDLRDRFRDALAGAQAAYPDRYSLFSVSMEVARRPRGKVIGIIERLEEAARSAPVSDAEVVEGDARATRENKDGGGDDRPAPSPEATGTAEQANAEEERPAAASDPVEVVDGEPVDPTRLRRELSDLYDEVAAAETAENDAEVERINAKIDDVESRLAAVGGDLPGQEPLL